MLPNYLITFHLFSSQEMHFGPVAEQALNFIFNSLILRSSAFCATGKMLCGQDVHYPFWYQAKDSSNSFFSDNQDSSYSTKSCGYSGFEINCIDIDRSIDIDQRALMNISNQLYYVLRIDYYNKKLTLLDVDVDGQDCPHPKRNISLESTPSLYGDRSVELKWYLFYNCSIHPADNDSYHNIPCLDNYYNSTTVPLRSYSYLGYFPGSRMPRNCEETVVIPSAIAPYYEGPTYDHSNYTKSAKFGFELTWSAPIDCEKCERTDGNCYYNNTKRVYLCDCNIASSVDGSFCLYGDGMPTGLKVIIGASTGVGGLLLILLLIFRKTFYTLYHSAISSWKKKIIKKPSNVEEFLESHGVALHRYRFSEIKKMTNSFKDTLGQGGYGSVFRGKLNRDGLLVAVKVLNEAKGNGEDFINEVATIGRTNHVNVVSLLGFCIEGTKRALVYEFMPNGSLEKFIYNDKTSSPSTTTLGWDKLYQITLGIARGLEYLHYRCNTRIVHFDIKPHNILLDQAFCPKISDFGLAKLCPTKESKVSMVGARGTMGYIAPEISCRNLGDVSHKSDVYSYGMMVLEMIGGRKNLDVTVENISEIYFPHWIYNQLKQDSKVEGPEVMKFEGAGEILKNATSKKMIITALWCIQTHPVDRPSMTKVVEMLEGSNEELQMPPNPSLDPLSLSSSSAS